MVLLLAGRGENVLLLTNVQFDVIVSPRIDINAMVILFSCSRSYIVSMPYKIDYFLLEDDFIEFEYMEEENKLLSGQFLFYFFEFITIVKLGLKAQSWKTTIDAEDNI